MSASAAAVIDSVFVAVIRLVSSCISALARVRSSENSGFDACCGGVADIVGRRAFCVLVGRRVERNGRGAERKAAACMMDMFVGKGGANWRRRGCADRCDENCAGRCRLGKGDGGDGGAPEKSGRRQIARRFCM